MKKILTALLLLTFCTVQATFAGEVIIIGSDGQARYEDETKNIPVSQDVIQNTKQKNILNEVTVTDSTGKKESVYIDYKGNIKKVEEGQVSIDTQPIIEKVKEKKYQDIVSNAPKVMLNYESILSEYGYETKDNSSESKKEYMKMNLLDGDYVIGFKDAPYIAEYHKDRTLMGLAKVDKKVLNENKDSVIFYEYRVGYNTTTGMGLKHILFLEYEKGKYISQYIYNVDGKLLCRQINNDIYVAEEARNMIPDWSKKINIKVYNQSQPKKYQKTSKNIDANEALREVTGNTLQFIALPLFIIPPIGLIFLFAGEIVKGNNLWGLGVH